MLLLFLGEGWKIESAGGVTGEAYVAEHKGEKLFIKRNSTPFIAVLSAEGIVPKLLWTKRLENGDVITAQRFICGRELKAHEMKGKNVAKLLAKIHRSAELLDLYTRMDNEPLTPSTIIEDIRKKASSIDIDDLIEHAFIYLYENQEKIASEEKVVCHCDINHNNWMISNKGELYLIDWDGARVADPALDLGFLLYLYVPKEEWEEWLHHYGVCLTPQLCERMRWYAIAQILSLIIWHTEKKEWTELKKWKDLLKEIMEEKNAGKPFFF